MLALTVYAHIRSTLSNAIDKHIISKLKSQRSGNIQYLGSPLPLKIVRHILFIELCREPKKNKIVCSLRKIT